MGRPVTSLLMVFVVVRRYIMFFFMFFVFVGHFVLSYLTLFVFPYALTLDHFSFFLLFYALLSLASEYLFSQHTHVVVRGPLISIVNGNTWDAL